MTVTINNLLNGELVWKKEKVKIRYNDQESEMKRLEFQYEAIDNNYEVYLIEPMYDKETATPYLLLWCE
jgi:hypothetical protein